MSQSPWRILIQKDIITNATLDESIAHPDLSDGQIEVEVKSFALTTNNVTYAVVGGPFRYWEFYPTGDDTLGILPIWGFGEVTASKCADMPVGELLYGFFPMASHAVLEPGKISPNSIVDQSPHRKDLSLAYNQYQRVRDVDEGEKDFWPIYKPLLTTGYLIADQFEDDGFYDAGTVLIASASSKTAIGTAFSFHQLDRRPKLIGLTSPGNLDFVKSTGLYDEVCLYDDVESLSKDKPVAFVDMAGNKALVNRIHKHFDDKLHFSLLVGVSHWTAAQGDTPKNGPRITPFFAPGRIDKRLKDWGPEELARKRESIWSAFVETAKSLTRIEHHEGPKEALRIYKEMADGKVNPQVGLVLDV
ncbi:MAG: DUF2855 family protein [Sphingomonadales bacterium]|jgi:hypothetical protein